MVERSENGSNNLAMTTGDKPDRRRREYKPPTIEDFQISTVTLQGGSGGIDSRAGDRQP